MKIDQSARRIWALLLYWQHRSKHRDRLGRNNDSVQLERVVGAVVSAARDYFHCKSLATHSIFRSFFIILFYFVELSRFRLDFEYGSYRDADNPDIEVSASLVSLAYRYNIVAYPIFFYSFSSVSSTTLTKERF